MTIKKNQNASIRIWAQNPDHHLYNNNGSWWLHYTSYPDAISAKRIRRSLGTRNLHEARERRDAFLAQLFHEQRKEVAA
jgi:hypothetical protein